MLERVLRIDRLHCIAQKGQSASAVPDNAPLNRLYIEIDPARRRSASATDINPAIPHACQAPYRAPREYAHALPITGIPGGAEAACGSSRRIQVHKCYRSRIGRCGRLAFSRSIPRKEPRRAKCVQNRRWHNHATCGHSDKKGPFFYLPIAKDRAPEDAKTLVKDRSQSTPDRIPEIKVASHAGQRRFPY